MRCFLPSRRDHVLLYHINSTNTIPSHREHLSQDSLKSSSPPHFPKWHRWGYPTTNCPAPAPSHLLSYVPSYPTLSCFWAGVKRRKRRKFRVGFRKFAYRFLIFCQPADFHRGRMDFPSSSRRGGNKKGKMEKGRRGLGGAVKRCKIIVFSFLFLFSWQGGKISLSVSALSFLCNGGRKSPHYNFSSFPLLFISHTPDASTRFPPLLTTPPGP